MKVEVGDTLMATHIPYYHLFEGEYCRVIKAEADTHHKTIEVRFCKSAIKRIQERNNNEDVNYSYLSYWFYKTRFIKVS